MGGETLLLDFWMGKVCKVFLGFGVGGLGFYLFLH